MIIKSSQIRHNFVVKLIMIVNKNINQSQALKLV